VREASDAHASENSDLAGFGQAVMMREHWVRSGRRPDQAVVTLSAAGRKECEFAPTRSSAMDQPSRVIVMKVGVHLGEPWEAIVERKLAEERAAGVAYWGYGGSVCHPITQVQPFAEHGSSVAVLMIRTRSDFLGNSTPAVAASVDGGSWEPIPASVATSARTRWSCDRSGG